MLTRHCHCSDPLTPHFWNWTSWYLGLMMEYHKVISQLNTQLESTLPTSTTMLLAESASSMWKYQRRRTQQILCQAWPSFQLKLLQIQHPKWKCGFWYLLSILKLHTTASCTSSSIRIPLVLSWMTSALCLMIGRPSSPWLRIPASTRKWCKWFNILPIRFQNTQETFQLVAWKTEELLLLREHSFLMLN